jgi:hypothetical protein
VYTRKQPWEKPSPYSWNISISIFRSRARQKRKLPRCFPRKAYVRAAIAHGECAIVATATDDTRPRTVSIGISRLSARETVSSGTFPAQAGSTLIDCTSGKPRNESGAGIAP